MSRFGDEPDIELLGRVEGSTPASYKFWPDFGPDEMLFVPHSQSVWVPDPDSDEGRGSLFVKSWLVRKNGWVV